MWSLSMRPTPNPPSCEAGYSPVAAVAAVAAVAVAVVVAVAVAVAQTPRIPLHLHFRWLRIESGFPHRRSKLIGSHRRFDHQQSLF